MDVGGMDDTDVFSSYQPMGMDSRRRSIASMTAVGGPLAVVPPLRSITPSPRYHPSLRSDRLTSRLRSNSGLTFHTNGAVLDQYINYQNNGGPPRPPSATSGALQEEDTSGGGVDLLTETYLESSQGDGFNSADVDLQSCLPFLDFLGLGAFQMSLDNPAISRQLLRYCEEHGCPEHVEFLLKVQEYNLATDEIASVLTGIATSFTSPAAKNPLSLPPMLSRQLNVDIKRMAHTLLPGMESVFIDATRHVKKRIARDAFPGFVQTQFTHCASVALSSGTHGIGSPKLEYPGLGESFCISTVSNVTSPSVLAAGSDAFATLTGYPLSEIIASRGCDFMHGSFTDQTTVTRIRAALREGREVSELILNYRRDGEPFWNLFTLFPLKDQQGRLWYWLGAQIDVSESVTSRRDLLRVLNRGRSPDAPGGGGAAAEEANSTVSSETTEKDSDNLSREGSLRSNSRSGGGFLHQFRRGTRSPSPPPTPTATMEKNPFYYNHNNSSKTSDSGRPVPRGTRLFAQEYLPRPRAPTVLPVCAHYLVLACEQFIPATTVSSSHNNNSNHNNNHNMMIPQRIPTPGGGGTPKKKQQSLKLNVAFYSEAAAELLGIRHDVTRMGVFQVLEDHANSPSVTRSFKSMVRERIEFGKSVSAEILVDRGRNPLLFFGGGRKPNHHNNHTSQSNQQNQQQQQPCQYQYQYQQQQQQHHYHFHHRLMGGGGSGSSGGGSGGGSNNGCSRPGSSADGSDHYRHNSGDNKLERKMMMMAARAGSTSKQEKVMSHWTPLKNANGDVEWVILVLAPRSTA